MLRHALAMTPLAFFALSFLLGLRHATDADHVVAVTNIIARQRRVRAAMLLGALWGLGHTVTVLIVGGAIVAFGLVIPPRLGLSMELSVALMLVVLGVMNLSGAFEGLPAQHKQALSAGTLRATAQRPAKWLFRSRRAWRPIVVGIVHGLAGSAAVALLVLSAIRELGPALLYLGIFGVGTIAGMGVLTALISLPIALATQHLRSFERWVTYVTGFGSIAFGLLLAYRIGVVDGLFSADPLWLPQ